MAFASSTAAALSALAEEAQRLATLGGFTVEPAHFVFAGQLPGVEPPRPNTFSHAFARIRERAGVAADVHLHSLRHFQATALDTVISERQKQARLGWSTVHMACHHTDGIDEEDRRAAEHIGRLLAGEEHCALTYKQAANRARMNNELFEGRPAVTTSGRQWPSVPPTSTPSGAESFAVHCVTVTVPSPWPAALFRPSVTPMPLLPARTELPPSLPIGSE